MRHPLLLLALCLASACGESDPPPPPEAPEPETPEETAEAEAEPGGNEEAEPPSPAPTTSGSDTARPDAPDDELGDNPTLPGPAAEGQVHVFAITDEDFMPFEPEEGEEPYVEVNDPGDDGALFVMPSALAEASDVDVQLTDRQDPVGFLEYRFPRFDYDDPRLERLVNARVESFARSVPSRNSPGLHCEGTATTEFVSVACASEQLNSRNGVEPDRMRTLNLAITEDGLVPMDVEAAFLAGFDLNARLLEHCEAARAENPEMECGLTPPWSPHVTFGEGGVHYMFVSLQAGEGNAMTASYTLAYDDLAEHMVAQGPLARALFRGHVETRAVSGRPGGTPPGPARDVWALGTAASRAELAARWLGLDDAGRAATRLVANLLTAPDEEAARAIAARSGLEAHSAQVFERDQPSRLERRSTQRDIDLLVFPQRGSVASRRLPRGTLVALLPGGVEGRYTKVVAHADAVGFVDTRALGAFEGCAPDLGRVLASVPESERAYAAVHTLRAITAQSGWGRATYLREGDSGTHVEMHRLDSECAFERVIVAFERERAVRLVQITHSERGSGVPLVVTVAGGIDGPEGDLVAVHSYRDGTEIWRYVLALDERVEVGRSVGGAWFPVVIEGGDEALRFAWTDGSLTRAAATPPDAP